MPQDHQREPTRGRDAVDSPRGQASGESPAQPREPGVRIVGKKRGRPRAAMPSTAVGTWLPVPYADRLIKLVHDRGMSLSAVTRQLLICGLKRV